MTVPKKRKSRINKFGYGALALYAFAIVLTGLGIYGINLSTLMARLNESERIRAQMRTGSMTIVTKDREQCVTYRFDNVTSEVTAEKMVECEGTLGPEGNKNSGSFNIFQRGFQNR